MSNTISDAKRLGGAFAEWVKIKHPDFIEKNKNRFNPTIVAQMMKLYYEYIKEIGAEPKKNVS